MIFDIGKIHFYPQIPTQDSFVTYLMCTLGAYWAIFDTCNPVHSVHVEIRDNMEGMATLSVKMLRYQM